MMEVASWSQLPGMASYVHDWPRQSITITFTLISQSHKKVVDRLQHKQLDCKHAVLELAGTYQISTALSNRILGTP
jgi:hypothetical protein